VPALRQKCAQSGVAVVFIPELPKTGVSGATRWIGDKAIIQLSLRYKTNDQLWFTFFHEAGHILRHGRKDIFIESNNADSEQEKEADVFARDFLVPKQQYDKFLNSEKRTIGSIQQFAKEIGIAPGIVVGRLQHDHILPFKHGNHLKHKLQWVER
jgi:Zn-dependent peptidase ImmA (M78 family)